MFKIKIKYLILFTGFIWLFAGFMLLHRAYTWFDLLTKNQLLISVVLAIILAVIKTYFIFHKLTIRNINRILSFKEKIVSIWEFHVLKDKILIVLMISMGSLLRNTPFISKLFLMPIYIGIGLAMFYSASLYLKKTFQIK